MEIYTPDRVTINESKGAEGMQYFVSKGTRGWKRASYRSGLGEVEGVGTMIQSDLALIRGSYLAMRLVYIIKKEHNVGHF